MTTQHRRPAVIDGQLTPEFRSRIKSGFQVDHHDALANLIADIGEPCWLSGPTAAALHHFEGFRLSPPYHLVTTRQRNVRRIGVVVHTSEQLDPLDREAVGGFPVTAPARTLIDLSGIAPREALTAALDCALRDGLISEAFLHKRINALRGKGRYGIPNLLAVIEGVELTRGAHSWLEREVLRLLHAANVALPTTQQVLGRRGDRLIRVDFRFPGTPLVVEALGTGGIAPVPRCGSTPNVRIASSWMAIWSSNSRTAMSSSARTMSCVASSKPSPYVLVDLRERPKPRTL